MTARLDRDANPPSGGFPPGVRVALAHDYLTQRGGAERVALHLARAFPGSPLYTTVYDEAATFEGFKDVDVRPVPWLSQIPGVARDVRVAMPLLAGVVSSAAVIDADVLLASSSGWAHGFRTSGRSVVYCHNPARWLYQPQAYFGRSTSGFAAAHRVLSAPLRRWDRKRASRVHTYVANSSNVATRMHAVYGRSVEVLHPPRGLDPHGPQEPVPGIEPGYFLNVSRPRGYKRAVDLLDAFDGGNRRLVQVGAQSTGRPQVTGLTGLPDEQLRWLYAHARALIAIGDEDFGLTPVEAYAFGVPAVVLAAGGYLETSAPAATVFVSGVSVTHLQAAFDEVEARSWDAEAIRSHADSWSPQVFADRIRGIVATSVSADPQ